MPPSQQRHWRIWPRAGRPPTRDGGSQRQRAAGEGHRATKQLKVGMFHDKTWNHKPLQTTINELIKHLDGPGFNVLALEVASLDQRSCILVQCVHTFVELNQRLGEGLQTLLLGVDLNKKD